MENDKPNIKEELGHIKNTIKQKDDKSIDDNDFIILDKIVSKGKKSDFKEISNNKFKTENKKKINNIIKKEIVKSENQSIIEKKNIINKTPKPVKKTKDPVAALVDREIKPIIKKWIGKNLKSFVKTIVIQEMKLISKATQKHK